MVGTGLLDLEKHFAFYGAYHSNPINVLIHMLFVWPIVFTALLILYFTPPIFGFPQVEFSLFGAQIPLLLNVGFLLTVIYAVFYVCLDAKAGSLAALLCVACWIGSSYVSSQLGFSLTWKQYGVNLWLCDACPASIGSFLYALSLLMTVIGAISGELRGALSGLLGKDNCLGQCFLIDLAIYSIPDLVTWKFPSPKTPLSTLVKLELIKALLSPSATHSFSQARDAGVVSQVVLVAQILCWSGQFIGHGVFEKRAPALLDNLAQAFLMAPFFVLLEALQKFFGYEPCPGFYDRVQAKIELEIMDWQGKKQKLIP